MNKFVLEKRASLFRAQCGLNDKECIRFSSILSHLNVITVFRPLSGAFAGMAIKVDNSEREKETYRFMMVNSEHSLGKQHFTICHELYHLYIQENFEFKQCQTGVFDKSKDPQEYYADVFAAYLLMPETGIKSMIPDQELVKNKISIQTILKLEQYYSCSRMALLIRLKELQVIDRTCFDSYCQHPMKSAVKNGYPINLYRAANHNKVLGDYGSIANQLFEKEKISESHYMSLLYDLGMNSQEVEELFNGTLEE